MKLVNFKKMSQEALKGGYAIGAYNFVNLEGLKAILESANECNSPVVIQTSTSAIRYMGLDTILPMVKSLKSNVKVCLNLDHGQTFEDCKNAIDAGYTNVMIDGSHLPYEENVKMTKEVVKKAHALNVSVEAELGRLATNEDGSEVEMNPENFYTNPEEAAEFVKETGVDALAVCFGTSHGFYKAAPKLNFKVIEECRASTHLPLVMHGGSGVSDEGFRKAIDAGIRKINYYSYMSKAGYLKAKEVIESNRTLYFHDVVYAAMKAMKENVKEAMRTFALLDE